MISYKTLFESGDGAFKLQLVVETMGFDFETETRMAKVSLIAVNDGESTVSAYTEGSLGNLRIFGRTFMLPGGFTSSGNTTTTIFVENLSEISNSVYNTGSSFSIELRFISEDCGLTPAKISENIGFPPIYRFPRFSLSCGENITLGENITVRSDHFDYGFSLDLRFFDGESLIFSKIVNADDNVFFADPNWASNHPNDESFDIMIKAFADFDGIILPESGNLLFNCSLPSDGSGPTAAVSVEYIYDSDIEYNFGVPLVNRTKLKIKISDINCYYGATIAKTEIKYNGLTATNMDNMTYDLSISGWRNWSVTLTDSRGNTRVYSDEVWVRDYGPPDFDAAVERVFNESEPTEDIKFRITPSIIYSLSGANIYTYAYRFRNCAEDNFSGWIAAQSSTDVIISAGMEVNEVYEIQLRATDSAGLSTIHTYTVTCTRTDLHVGRNRVGIGKKAEHANTLDCAWDIKCDGDISFTSSGGELVSMRELVAGNLTAAAFSADEMSTVQYLVRTAATEQNINDIVNNDLIIDENCGLYIVVVCVTSIGLSLSKGVHFYIVFNDGVNSGYAKL